LPGACMSARENIQGVFELFTLMESEIERLLEDLPDDQGPAGFPAYGRIYDIPVGRVTGFIFDSFGLLEKFSEIAQGAHPRAGIIEYAKVAEPSLDVDVEKLWPILCAWYVLMKNLECISLFHVSIQTLVSRVAAGDDEALFNAVFCDPSVLQSETVAQRVSTAVVADDGQFFEKLSKAIKKSRPVRPREHLDEVRMMLALVDESDGLDSVSDATLANWATQLDLYPVDSDALQAVRRQRQKHQKATSHQ
jgi:hypothetical protein